MTFNGGSIFVAVVVLVAIGFGGGYLLWSGGDNIKTVHFPGEKLIEIDTVYSVKTITKEKIIPTFTKEIVEAEGRDIDSLKKGLELERRGDTIFVASLDTTLFDSLLHLRLRYNSPIPLDQAAYFSLESQLKERNVVHKETIVVESDPGIINKWLHFGVVVAAGYGIINKKHDVFIGLGVMIGL